MKSLKPTHFTTLLVAIVVALSTGSLAYERFVNSTPSAHTEIISSFETGAREVFVDGTKIWLDDRTEVEVAYEELEFDTDAIEIDVIQGRIVVEGKSIIKTRDTVTAADGLISYVHYSWDNKIEVSVFSGAAIVNNRNDTERDPYRVDPGTTLSVSTLPPYQTTESTFDPEKSSAAEFYKQFLK